MKKTLLTLFLTLVAFSSTWAYVAVDGIYYNLNQTDKTAEVTYINTFYNNYSGSVVIPSSITYNEVTYSVTKIGNSAFRECRNLTSVTIPNSVTSIGNDAFSKCM